MPDEFTAQVSRWVSQSKDRVTAVFRTAAQTVANEMRIPVQQGGNMPVLTGNLRRSLMGSTSVMPTLSTDNKEQFSDGIGETLLVIANAKLDEHIYLGWQAAYAPYQEEKHGFVRLTAQRWPQIVAEACRTVQGKVG